MQQSHKKPTVQIVMVFIFLGLVYPSPVIPTYEGAPISGMTSVHTDSFQEEDNYTYRLDLYKIEDADPDKDYYYVEYVFDDLRYGADSVISPGFIEVELFATSLGAVGPTLGLLLSYRNPDPGWLTPRGLFTGSAGRIVFSYDEDGMGSAWVKWNISGTGGWPLLIHVAGDEFLISLGFYVGEIEGISIEVTCSITWVSINRFVGLVQYVDQISTPSAEVVNEP